MKDFYSSPLYKGLPIPLQNAFATLKGLAYTSLKRGRRFAFLQKQLIDNEKLSADQLAALQLSKLQIMLRHASENVPYYQGLFRKLGFDPGQLKAVDELKQLPILEKETIRKHLSQFVASNANKRFLFKGSTGGSTGTPLSLYMNRELIQGEHAFIWRQYRWAGCPPNGRIALVRGDMIVPGAQKRPPYWRFDLFSKQLWFSSYHISAESIEAYIGEIEKFEPDLIYGFPSSLFALSSLAKESALKVFIPSLKGVVTSSETLYEHQRSLIEEIFKVPVFDWYGTFERVVFIGTCELGRRHIFPDYGVTELLPVSQDRKANYYELVGTGFLNWAIPLIRYRTGDLVTLEEGKCKCGRDFPLLGSIIGRLDDVVITPKGRLVGFLLYYAIHGVRNVSATQIIQDKLDELTVLVVPKRGFSKSESVRIEANIRERVGEGMKITVNLVNEIGLLPNGKFRGVISKVKW